jgi:hypothetical protein
MNGDCIIVLTDAKLCIAQMPLFYQVHHDCVSVSQLGCERCGKKFQREDQVLLISSKKLAQGPTQNSGRT